MMAHENLFPRHVEPAVLTRLLASSADAALVIDSNGVIREVVGVSLPSSWHELVGKVWRDTVTRESQAKVESLLQESAASGQSKAREINQLVGREERPFRFSAVRMAPGSTVALGRDLGAASTLQQQMLSAQQALEREYARLRQDESRYRMLYHLSSEGVLIVDGGNLKVVDINPSAAVMLESDARSLVGRSILELFHEADEESLRSGLRAVATGGPAATLNTHLRGSGRAAALAVSASRQGQSSTLLVRLVQSAAAGLNVKRMQMIAALDALPDAFVIVDEALHVLSANPMFCELAQLSHETEAAGQPLSRWLGRPGVDGNVIAATLREHGVVRNFATILRGTLGQSTDVILSAVSALHGDVPCIAFVMRPASARTSTTAPTARSVEQLRELVGQVSLKELVRESAELVERMCIEAALQLTGNNRASAAQLLGLSRQGLYSKLRRHGLGS